MAGARTRRDFLGQGLRAGAALAASPLLAATARSGSRRPRGPAAPLPRPRAALRLRVLPLVRRPARLRALGLPRAAPAARPLDPLRAEARGLRRALGRGARAARALDPRGRRRRRRALLVGPRELGGPDGPADPRRAARPRPQGHLRARALRRRPRALLRERHPVSAARVRREAALGQLPAARATPTAASAPSSRASGRCCPRPPRTASARSTRSRTSRRTRRGGGRPTRCATRSAPTSTTSRCSPTRSSSPARRPRASTASASTTTTSRPRAIAATPRAPRAPGLLFSFNVNPGYDQIEPRQTSDPCYAPRDFAPPTAGPRLRDRRWPRARGPRLGRADPSLVGGNARRPARPGPRQRPQGLPARLPELLQRMARRPRLRADEGLRPSSPPTSAPSATATPSAATTGCGRSPSCSGRSWNQAPPGVAEP